MIVISIELRFLSGRYHATPWGHHVNEGAIEWPPSPWRLLRALTAVWKLHFPDVSAAEVGELLLCLTDPPVFHLPQASVGHTRHYMPLYRSDKTTLVFDTFVALDQSAPVYIQWPDTALSAAQMRLLRRLTENLHYLGRAESWCEASVRENEITDAGPYTCTPLAGSARGEPIRLLLARSDTASGNDLLAGLQVETGWLRERERKAVPPQAQWAIYDRPTQALVPQTSFTPIVPSPVRAVVFRLDRKPLPSVTDTVIVAERARRAVMARFGRLFDGSFSPVLSGRSNDGKVRVGHQHAFYLPVDYDGDGYLDHLIVYAFEGFDAQDMAALASLRWINLGTPGASTAPDDGLRVLMLNALGDAQLQSQPSRLGIPIHLDTSPTWGSVTPFVPGRHPKWTHSGLPRLNAAGRQVDSPEDQIWRLWTYRRKSYPKLPALERVEPVSRISVTHGGVEAVVGSIDPLELQLIVRGDRKIRWQHFRKIRLSKRPPAMGTGYAFRLTFADSVAGPIALGYGAHFGLGLFAPCM